MPNWWDTPGPATATAASATSKSSAWWDNPAPSPPAVTKVEGAPVSERSNAAAPEAAPAHDEGILDTLENMSARDWVAAGVRQGGGYLASIPSVVPGLGTLAGAGIGAGSEALAEMIANRGYDPKAIGIAGAVGAIPMGSIFKEGLGVLPAAVRGAGLNVGIDLASRAAHAGDPDAEPFSYRDEILPAVFGAAGGAGAAALHNVFAGRAGQTPAGEPLGPSGFRPLDFPEDIQKARAEIRDPETLRRFDETWGTSEPPPPAPEPPQWWKTFEDQRDTGDEAAQHPTMHEQGDEGDINEPPPPPELDEILKARTQIQDPETLRLFDEHWGTAVPASTPSTDELLKARSQIRDPEVARLFDERWGTAPEPNYEPGTDQPWWVPAGGYGPREAGLSPLGRPEVFGPAPSTPEEPPAELPRGGVVEPPPAGTGMPSSAAAAAVPAPPAAAEPPTEPGAPPQERIPFDWRGILEGRGQHLLGVPGFEILDPETATLNASGESAASLEALHRQAGMAAKGEQFVVYDRTGARRPLIGPDAVDYHVQPGETYGIEGPEGFRVLDDAGGKPPAPGELAGPPRELDTETPPPDEFETHDLGDIGPLDHPEEETPADAAAHFLTPEAEQAPTQAFTGADAKVKRAPGFGQGMSNDYHVEFPDGRKYVIYKNAGDGGGAIRGSWQVSGLEDTGHSGTVYTKKEMLDQLANLDESKPYVDKFSGRTGKSYGGQTISTIKDALDQVRATEFGAPPSEWKAPAPAPREAGTAAPAPEEESPAAAVSRFFDPSAHEFSSPRFDPAQAGQHELGDYVPPTEAGAVPATAEDRLRMVMGDEPANDIISRAIWQARQSGKPYVKAEHLERFKGGGKPTFTPDQLQKYRFLWNKERKAMLALDELAGPARTGEPPSTAPGVAEPDRQAHKGYMVQKNPFNGKVYVTKDGFNIGGEFGSVADAKAMIDRDLTDTRGERGAVSTSALFPLATTLAGAAAGPFLEPDNKKLGVAGGAGAGLLLGLALHNPALLNRLRYSTLLSYMSVPKKLGGDLGELMYTAAEHPDRAGDLAKNLFSMDTLRAAREGYLRPTDQSLIERVSAGRAPAQRALDFGEGAPKSGFNALDIPSRALSGITEGMQSVYERAGFTPDEALERTFVNQPQSEAGRWLASGAQKPLVNVLLPVAKVATNIMERGISRTPGLSTLESVRNFSGLSPAAARRAAAITGLAMLGAGGAGYATGKGGPLEDYAAEADALPLLTGGAMVPVGAAMGAGRALSGGGAADALAALGAGWAKGLPLPHGFEPSDLAGTRAKATLARLLAQYVPFGGLGRALSPVDPKDFDTTNTLFGPTAAELPLVNEELLNQKRHGTPRIALARSRKQ